MIRPFQGLRNAVFGRRPDRRLTRRIQVQIPLSVQGQGPRISSFNEDTRTISINANGGLMSLVMPVLPGQRLLVTNHGNERTEEALVVWAKPKSPSGMNIGFRFSSATPQFWANLEIGKNARGGAEGGNCTQRLIAPFQIEIAA